MHSKAMTILKKSLVFILITLLVITGLLYFMPTFIQIPIVKETALRLINPILPGHLQIKSCILDWQKESHFEEVSFTHKSGQLFFKSQRLTLHKGLLKLLFDRVHIGKIEIINPQVDIYISQNSDEAQNTVQQHNRLNFHSTESTDTTILPLQKEPTKKTHLPNLNLMIIAKEGTARIFTTEKLPHLTVQDLSCKVNVQGSDNPVEYTIRGRSSNNEGTLDIHGSMDMEAVFNPSLFNNSGKGVFNLIQWPTWTSTFITLAISLS